MILCCGEALIDLIPVERGSGETAYVPHPGGAIFNTASALGRLGVQTGMLSGVSTDRFGVMLADALTKNGVCTNHLVRSDRPTTLAIVHLVEGRATYSFYDERSAGRELHPADMPVLGSDVRALLFGGISLIAEPAADAYADFLDREYHDRIVMLDPNIRPDMITDEKPYRARLARMFAKSTIVKVSDEDLDWLFPGTNTLAENAAVLRQHGAKVVIVTRGSKGATAFFQEGEVTVPAVSATVVDTVGAGDTFNAGFLAGLQELGCMSAGAMTTLTPKALEFALTFGAQVAAITVSRAGANSPWAHELER